MAEPKKAPPGTEFARDDLRGSPREFFRGVHGSISTGTVSAAVGSFRPLVFGAAYKVADLLVEMVMHLNREPFSRRWTFQQKSAFLLRGSPQLLPSPLDGVPGLWERLAKLYVALDEHRHAVVHRRITVEPDGSLVGHDRAGAALRPLSIEEQDAWTLASFAIAEAVIASDVNPRMINTVGWGLDELRGVHGMSALGASRPASVVLEVIDNLEYLGSDRWRLDGRRLHAHLREQDRAAFDAEAELHASKEGEAEVVYRASLAQVPDDVTEFAAATPPAWLRSS
ncbi:MAG: hypothetical protein HY874_07720 [Chloroflexi bacterium]|nr:hypothetical protein [Chloroflexota bacterium]